MDSQSVVAVFLEVVFGAGGATSGVGFWRMFRQLRLELADGYTTLDWKSLRGNVLVIDPRTRRIRRGTVAVFDAAAARARAPWASSVGGGAGRALAPPTGPPARARTGGGWAVIVGILLAAAAIWVRVQHGTLTVTDSLQHGAIVLGALLIAFFVAVAAVRTVQVRRLSRVSEVAQGIIVAGFSDAHLVALSSRLGAGKSRIPRFPVLVFDADGFAIWQGWGIPCPVVVIDRSDIMSIEITSLTNGRSSSPGLEITVIPADERWPVSIEFTVFDPSRTLAAANEKKLQALIASITDVWTRGSAQ